MATNFVCATPKTQLREMIKHSSSVEPDSTHCRLYVRLFVHDSSDGTDEGVGKDDKGSEGEGGDEDGLPHLKDLHKEMPEYKDAKCVDGAKPTFAFDALGSEYFPWRNLTELLIGIWAIIYRPSRKSLQIYSGSVEI